MENYKDLTSHLETEDSEQCLPCRASSCQLNQETISARKQFLAYSEICTEDERFFEKWIGTYKSFHMMKELSADLHKGNR